MLFQLENEDWEGQHDQCKQDHCEVGVAVDGAIVLRERHEPPDSARDHQQRVDEVAEQKQKEEFVIARAQAVIDEGAVMVVVVGASVADCAVEWVFSFNYFVVDAQVVQVNVLLQEVVH